ncbi:MAG: translocation/assembly module TamB, partial [Chlamydiia bacterium]|nr:translocation/assembly module TamB [Chlamydiia bacterium]
RASIEDLVGGMEASISLRDIPLDILNVLRPTTPVSGTLTGQARLQGSRDSPIGDCLIQLHNFRLIEPGFQQVNPVNAQLSLSLADQRTAVQMEITGLDSKPVDIHGNLPIGLALDPLRLIVNPRNDHINLSVDAHGELGGFMQLFVPDSNRITGRFDIALNLLGTWDRPNIKGSIDLSKGIYHSLHTGSSFTNIEAHLVGRGQEIELESLSASDGAHGNLSATGKLSLARSEHYAFALTTHIHNCILVNMPAVNAIFDGRVTLEGDTLSGMLSGKLDVHHADLSIPEEINEAVPKLDVVYINQPAYEPQPTLLAPVADYWVLNLDLNVRARGQTFLRGRGLMSEWEGEGRVRGNTGEPLLYGKLSLVRGEYNFIGRIFTLTFGELLFNGPLRKNTSLNVSAELAMDGLTAQATLAGQLSEPQLALRSNPSRPLKEILSRILFEKEVHDITPLQGLELAQALLSMTNKKGGPDFVGTIRRNIGLDRLDISHNSNDPNEISVHAGKYIARGVFVSVNKSVNSVNNDISLEMRLSDQVKLEGQVGDKIGSKVSLKWKMDY